MGSISLWMFCIIGPMNCAFGGTAAGDDYLSYLSFGNVQNGSWLYWVHAFAVWGVVATVQISIYTSMKQFLKLRFAWLKNQSDSRANTILVEGIPDDYQSDEKLKEYFAKMVPGSQVVNASVVKDTAALKHMLEEQTKAKAHLAKANAEWELLGKPSDRRPMTRTSFMGSKVDAIEYYTGELSKLEPNIVAERKRIQTQAAASVGPPVNLTRGFVTFQQRLHKELVVNLSLTPDKDEFVMLSPPDADDIIWSDMLQDPGAESIRHLLGWALTIGLTFAYLPIVLGVTNLAVLIDLGPLQPLWQGLAPTLGLLLMVCFLPTFLHLIFGNFFTLRAHAFSQHKVQVWYFWFQVIFVILATAVGTNFTQFINTLANEPLTLPLVLADTMPFATHFYMNYVCALWAAHALNLTRYTQYLKYLSFSKLFDEETAKEMAEPEDQDYYGMGSRSARFTITLAIGIVFGTLSPPVGVITFINFCICRIIYGYLLPFAEKKKADLGGVFWVTSLKHLFWANIIYVTVMTGVFMRRASSYGPACISGTCFVYVIWSMTRFDKAFSWVNLPHGELTDLPVSKKSVQGYVQPELAGK